MGAQVPWQIYECVDAPRYAGGVNQKRTVLADKQGAPGLATANMLAQLRGHPGEDKNCRCSTGFILKGGELVKAVPKFTKGVRNVCWKVKPFAQHTFNAGYFAEMDKNNTTYLPLGHAKAVMDFAMGFTCIQNGEVQSVHWCPETVTLFVCIIYRHANMLADGKESTAEVPIIIKDFVFGVSDDRKQNARVGSRVSIAPYLLNVALAVLCPRLCCAPRCCPSPLEWK